MGPTVLRELSLPARTLLRLRRFAARQPLGATSLALLGVFVFVALFAGTIAPYGPTKIDVGEPLVGPSSAHLFGTDQFGRDVFSRVVFGARVSLWIGIASTVISVAVATVLGAVSGYFSGFLDYLVQRIVDAAQAIPPLVLLLGIAVALGPSTSTIIIALSARGGLTLSRVIRGSVIGVRNQTYMEAARAIGVPHWRMIAMHLLPNIFPAVIILISTSIGANILAEASLSFLGQGVPPPNPSWGGMAATEARNFMLVNPWMLVFPTATLALVVFAVNMFGDAIRDEFDPRLRNR